MKIIFAAVCFLTFGALAWADNPTIVLDPGSRATVYNAPTDVVCNAPDAPAFQRYCKCGLEGFSAQYTLDIVLDDQGNTDQLGKYPTQQQCEKSLAANPACAGH